MVNVICGQGEAGSVVAVYLHNYNYSQHAHNNKV